MKSMLKIAFSSLLLFWSLLAISQREKTPYLEKEIKCFASNSDFEARKWNDPINLSRNSKGKECLFNDEGLIIANSQRFVPTFPATTK